MWRKPYNIRWTIYGAHLCFKASYGSHTFTLQPIGPDEGIENALEAMTKHFEKTGVPFVMRGAEKFMIDILEKWRPNYFNYSGDSANYDYVYLVRDLIELKGRKYHAKKNHINKFSRTYPNYRYLPLTAEWTDKCIKSLDKWFHLKEAEKDMMLVNERAAIIEVLRNFSCFSLQGGVIEINGEVEAFSFGEPLNDDMAVIHVEKATPEINGIFAVINQNFCANAWARLTYINREEDMGVPGLIKAKESYYPVKMTEKFIVSAKNVCSNLKSL